jgi:NAD-dependent SIR2 family protein deacetylase
MTEQASRLLLGAGLSVTAGVPSAWRVQEELLLKLAQAQGEAPEDPFACYHKKYRKHSKYSDLLEDVTHSQSERRSLLEGFFEPTAGESEQGLKQPTLAHRAIARLVDRGLVRVILTTNVDRLIEDAIHKETGKRATLVASPSEIRGMSPLHTQDCLVVHLHDQYRNPAGMLNTAEELEAYPSEVEDLLDEIFPKQGSAEVS